jgi:Cys-tRNA(Pro)/Cys-tRNA(Cys) deacylase
MPTAIEAAALAEALVYVNAGQRGPQVRLDPRDIPRAIGAVAAPVVA